MVIEVRNFTKIRVLLYLKEVARLATDKTEWGPDGFGGAFAWRAPATIANDTGVNVASLYTILKRWRSNTWGYADGKYFEAFQMVDGRPHWLYKINSKGLSYLARLHKWYEAEAEVEASLAEYQEANGCDCVSHHLKLQPRYIFWYVKPSNFVTYIRWPFESKGDVAYAVPTRFMCGHGQRVKDIEQAAGMAEIQFNIKPSAECLNYAKSVETFWVRKALTELATGAGLLTRK